MHNRTYRNKGTEKAWSAQTNPHGGGYPLKERKPLCKFVPHQTVGRKGGNRRCTHPSPLARNTVYFNASLPQEGSSHVITREVSYERS